MFAPKNTNFQRPFRPDFIQTIYPGTVCRANFRYRSATDTTRKKNGAICFQIALILFRKNYFAP